MVDSRGGTEVDRGRCSLSRHNNPGGGIMQKEGQKDGIQPCDEQERNLHDEREDDADGGNHDHHLTNREPRDDLVTLFATG